MDARGEWRRIRLLGRPVDYPVEGWVDVAFLGGRVDSKGLWMDAGDTEDPLEAVAEIEELIIL